MATEILILIEATKTIGPTTVSIKETIKKQ